MNFYYHPNPEENPTLSKEESYHLAKVLRSQIGDEIVILNGLGTKYHAKITEPNPKKCAFEITDKQVAKSKAFSVHVAIAPTKSTDRLEWFVEKTCELGIDEITIIQTQRTERKKVNLDRLEKKAVSAMKQSKNPWKCQINPSVKFKDFVDLHRQTSHKFAAYVETGNEDLFQRKIKPKSSILILIGPEGDFSPEEIEQLKRCNFELVSLGTNVLRTETAGVIAAHTVNLINQ